MKISIEGLQKETSASESKSLILLANEGKISAFGPASYGFVHDVVGFKAVDDNIEVSQHGQSVTFEYILEKNPDVLFVIDRSAAVGGEVAGTFFYWWIWYLASAKIQAPRSLWCYEEKFHFFDQLIVFFTLLKY